MVSITEIRTAVEGMMARTNKSTGSHSYAAGFLGASYAELLAELAEVDPARVRRALAHLDKQDDPFGRNR